MPGLAGQSPNCRGRKIVTGPADRPQPYRPWQTRQQTTSRRRPAGPSFGSGRDRGQPARLDCLRTLGRCNTSGARAIRPTAKPPGQAPADKGYDFARCRRHLRKRGISHELRAAASRRTIGSASIAGLLNALTPGLPRSASSVFVSSVASISILLCSRSPALSSAPDSLRTFVSGS